MIVRSRRSHPQKTPAQGSYPIRCGDAIGHSHGPISPYAASPRVRNESSASNSLNRSMRNNRLASVIAVAICAEQTFIRPFVAAYADSILSPIALALVDVFGITGVTGLPENSSFAGRVPHVGEWESTFAIDNDGNIVFRLFRSGSVLAAANFRFGKQHAGHRGKYCFQIF